MTDDGMPVQCLGLLLSAWTPEGLSSRYNSGMSFGLDRIAERKIAEAVEQGKFEDIAGKGRPLNLDDDPLTPPHLRLGNRILKNANVLPDRVQLEVAIRECRCECEQVWNRITWDYGKWRDYARREGTSQSLQRFADWRSRARSGYIRSLKRHNDEVLKHNLAAPNSPSIYIPYKLRDEIQRFDEAFPEPEGSSPVSNTQEAERKGTFRDSAAALYAAGLIKRD